VTGARHKAVFIDRDGVLNEMVYDDVHGLLDSPRKPEQVRLMPHAAEFLKGVKAAGYLAVVVTNQPGLAKGTLTEADLRAVNARLGSLLAEADARWDDLRCCPHHPSGGPWANPDYVRSCQCRKPLPGMLLDAAREQDIDLPQSWMIGDGLTDVQAGRAAGCRTILVTSLKIQQVEKFFEWKNAKPDAVCEDLQSSLERIRRGA